MKQAHIGTSLVLIDGGWNAAGLWLPPGTVVENNWVWANEGFTYLLSVGMNDGTKVSTWYFIPYSGNVTPTNALTAANFNSTLTETTNYTNASRPTWTEAAPSAASIGTSSNVTITADTGGMTIAGCGLISGATKSNYTGLTVLGAGKYDGGPFTIGAGGTFQLGVSSLAFSN